MCSREREKRICCLQSLQLPLYKASRFLRCICYIVTAKLTSINYSITGLRSFFYFKQNQFNCICFYLKISTAIISISEVNISPSLLSTQRKSWLWKRRDFFPILCYTPPWLICLFSSPNNLLTKKNWHFAILMTIFFVLRERAVFSHFHHHLNFSFPFGTELLRFYKARYHSL